MGDQVKKIDWIKFGIVSLVSIFVLGVSGCSGGSDASSLAESSQEKEASQDLGVEPDVDIDSPEASMCGLAGNDETVIDETPGDVEWEYVGTMLAPLTSDDGPGFISDAGLRQCYARSPSGALLAASNILAMGSDPNLVQGVNEKLVAEGPGRDSVLEDLELNGIPGDDSGLRLSIRGYNLMGHSLNASRIDLAVEATDGTFASVTIDLRWEDGDWKVELRDDGQPVIPVVQIQDVTMYNSWSAED
ncbi:hypothetical protein [Nocardiopsis valliformis]|uniref:hypothetical protein n=1 Tax=Nocardiopsis valliformis TaxID=239974 RepID=UPI001267850B|nr:hypothetical protein [Nocardiopsis valliformis]